MGLAAPQYAGKLESTDVAKIQGNAPDDAKHYVYGVFKHLVGHEPWFNHEIGKRIELKEVNIWGDAEVESAKAETVFEIKLSSDMCNIFGIMHGGCAAYLIDHCSVSSTVVLGTHLGEDGTGLSQSMNIVWSDAAPLGSTLRIVNTSVSLRGRTRTCRTEIWNGNKLCVSGIQSLINAPGKMVGASSPEQAQSPSKSHTVTPGASDVLHDTPGPPIRPSKL